MIYHGAIKCQCNTWRGIPCKNGAYWKVDEEPYYRCGTHSRKYERTKLAVDPDTGKKKTKLIKDRKDNAEEMMKENKRNGEKGKVI